MVSTVAVVARVSGNAIPKDTIIQETKPKIIVNHRAVENTSIEEVTGVGRDHARGYASFGCPAPSAVQPQTGVAGNSDNTLEAATGRFDDLAYRQFGVNIT